jgi:transcriptional regulator with XRE-family HTH domain
MESKKTTPFSAALTYCLNFKGLTQDAIAGEVGIGQSYVSALKRGDRQGDEEIRRKIAQAFGMGYEDFLGLGEKLLRDDLDVIDTQDLIEERMANRLVLLLKQQLEEIKQDRDHWRRIAQDMLAKITNGK